MRRKREERRKLRRLKFRTIFMLSITLIFNAYAWFLYVTTVSMNTTVHVEAWNIDFEVDNEAVERELLFEIEEAYPGMKDITKTISVTNSGEKVAEIMNNIASLKILDKTYIVEEQLSSEEKEQLTGTEIKMTQEEIKNMLANDFPFKMVIDSPKNQLNTKESSNITIRFTWEYESNNDKLDTEYGVESYKYYKQYEGEEPIKAKIKISVQQKREST